MQPAPRLAKLPTPNSASSAKSGGAPAGKGPPTQYDMWMNAEQAQRLAKICIANGIEN